MQYSIILKSQLEGGKRLDAEYYQPEYLEIAKLLQSIPHETLQGASETLVSFGAYALTSVIEWQEAGIPFITAENIKDGFIDYDGVRYISEKVDEVLRKSRVREGQVLLAMSGSVGNAAVAVNIPRRLNSNQDIVKITPRAGVSPYVLAAFLNSRYGRMQVLRLPVGSIQQHIFLWQMQTLLIPMIESRDASVIEQFYKDGLSALAQSESLFLQAEQTLLKELRLEDFEEDGELWSVVQLSEVQAAHRMDAEYFQPKYEKLIEHIKNTKYATLDEMSVFVGHATQAPYDEDGSIAVLAQKHMKRNLQIDIGGFDNFTTDDLIKKNDKKYILKKGDVLISSAGEPGLTSVWIGEREIKAIPGSFVTVARLKDGMDPLYVGVFLNTVAGRLQFERDYTGSVQQYVYPSKIINILISILPETTQKKIAELVRESHAARARAREFLASAKRTVEECVEKGKGLSETGRKIQ